MTTTTTATTKTTPSKEAIAAGLKNPFEELDKIFELENKFKSVLVELPNHYSRPWEPCEFLLEKYLLVTYRDPRQHEIERSLFEFRIEFKNFKDDLKINVGLNRKLVEEPELIYEFVDKSFVEITFKQENAYKTLLRKYLSEMRGLVKRAKRFVVKFEAYQRDPSVGFFYDEDEDEYDAAGDSRSTASKGFEDDYEEELRFQEDAADDDDNEQDILNPYTSYL